MGELQPKCMVWLSFGNTAVTIWHLHTRQINWLGYLHVFVYVLRYLCLYVWQDRQCVGQKAKSTPFHTRHNLLIQFVEKDNISWYPSWISRSEISQSSLASVYAKQHFHIPATFITKFSPYENISPRLSSLLLSYFKELRGESVESRASFESVLSKPWYCISKLLF